MKVGFEKENSSPQKACFSFSPGSSSLSRCPFLLASREVLEGGQPGKGHGADTRAPSPTVAHQALVQVRDGCLVEVSPLAGPGASGQAQEPPPPGSPSCPQPHRWGGAPGGAGKGDPPLVSHPTLGHGPLCCLRRGACLSAFLLLLLVTLAALIALVTILGRPPRTPGQRGPERVGWTCQEGLGATE